MNIQTPLRDILKTKASYFKKLDAMGLHTLQDLLFYFPRSYEDLSESKRVWELTPGQAVTIRGTLRSFDNRMARNRMQIQTATIMDDMGGEISAAFFNQAYIVEKFPIGIDVIISGKIKQDNYGKLTIQSPKIEKVGADQVHAGKIVAVYPESEVITSKWIREKIQPFIEYTKNIPETLPSDILDQEDLLSLGYAIEQLHNPESFETLEKAKERIAFEELFMLQLSALQQKYNYQKDTEVSSFNKQVSHDRDFLDSLVSKIPFSLTGDQTQSVDTVLQDMSCSEPMSRMVQGDVGSGKTIVAFLTAAMALRSGYQVAIMAPTEVLAKQHYKKANEFLRDVYIPSLSEEEREELAQDLFSEASGLQADMLIGSLTAKQKREIKQRIESGDARLIIGTHALVQDDVNFKHLGLVVIDEQHHF
ncbi:MAG: DEAD/DEAH box helicase [Patescibacteria group bacterium]|nr:DEAD/DEAH box helicase [Patescibacteria group bacterium]